MDALVNLRTLPIPVETEYKVAELQPRVSSKHKLKHNHTYGPLFLGLCLDLGHSVSFYDFLKLKPPTTQVSGKNFCCIAMNDKI